MTEPARRWQAGWSGEIDGIEFRIRPGYKTPRLPGGFDLVLEWRTPKGWRAVTMNPVALMAAFFWENEEMLYPPSMNPRWVGGRKILQHIERAISYGWEVARDYLTAEKNSTPPILALLKAVPDDVPRQQPLPFVWADYACEICGRRYSTATYGEAADDLGPARCIDDGGRFLKLPEGSG